jgi:uncharacterized protein YutE (UPF0331/DUF86 family)
MVNADVVRQKISRARVWLKDAAAVFGGSRTRYRKATKQRDLAMFYLFLAIQECIDLAAHWVADAGYGSPDDASTSFDLLAERGAIAEELATAMRAAIGLRNRIAHGYATVDYERVFDEAKTGLRALTQFLAPVANEA